MTYKNAIFGGKALYHIDEQLQKIERKNESKQERFIDTESYTKLSNFKLIEIVQPLNLEGQEDG